MTTPRLLPEGFAHLEKHHDWILSSERERIEARLTTDFGQTVAFYNEMVDELPAMMDYLLTRPITTDDPRDLALLDLGKTFAEIANAVELYGAPEVPDGANLRLFVSVLDGEHV